MYKKHTYKRTLINENKSVEGETIENKIERIVNNKEPIKDGAPTIFTERKEGVKASTNIRTDRFEIALDGIEKIEKSYKARREEQGRVVPFNKEKDGGTESIQGEVNT